MKTIVNSITYLITWACVMLLRFVKKFMMQAAILVTLLMVAWIIIAAIHYVYKHWDLIAYSMNSRY